MLREKHGIRSNSEARGFALLLALGILSVPFVIGQSQPTAKTLESFEVSTIKPTAPRNQGGAVWSRPGIGLYWVKSASLEFLIQTAFNLNPNQIAGKPAWLTSDYFDVEAKPEDGIALSREQLRPRLQELLQSRFHLVTHYETKIVPGYLMVPFKSGPKLQKTAGDQPPGFRVYVGPGRLEGLNWSMSYLASMLQQFSGRPVADETGIRGSYDIKVEYAPDMEADSSLPSLFTALKETLGLELKPKKIPVQVLVIDHVERVPTPN
jgi:uncharacterized protein (TIGR03435 family)